jgi:hypothetical protein
MLTALSVPNLSVGREHRLSQGRRRNDYPDGKLSAHARQIPLRIELAQGPRQGRARDRLSSSAIRPTIRSRSLSDTTLAVSVPNFASVSSYRIGRRIQGRCWRSTAPARASSMRPRRNRPSDRQLMHPVARQRRSAPRAIVVRMVRVSFTAAAGHVGFTSVGG